MSASPTKEPIADVVLEPHVGGRWYERSVSDREYDWGRVVVWEPDTRLVVAWSPDGHVTKLEVRFESPAPRSTIVTVVQLGLEAYGTQAEKMRTRLDAAWALLLDRFERMIKEQPPTGDAPSTHTVSKDVRAVTDGQTVLASVDISAEQEPLFRALTTRETEQWWGDPTTYRVTNWKSDLRVGGAWSLVVVTPDGSPFPSHGEYVEIDAPARIVLTRYYDFDYPELGRRETIVTYRLDSISTGTRVTVRHDGFDGLLIAANHHADGWVSFLEYLRAYASADSESP